MTLDAVVSLLEQTLHRLDGAASSIDVARAGAGTIEARTTEVGFLGIAAGMRLLRDLLGQVRRAQAEATAEVAIGAATARKVSAGRCPADVISSLSVVLRQIAVASAGSAVILKNVASATAQAGTSLKGGAPERMLGLLEEIERFVTDAVAHLGEAKAGTQELLADAKALGTTGRHSSMSGLGAEGAASPTAIVDARKYDYLFGKAAQDAHNTPRSVQNAAQLARVGVYDNDEGRDLLRRHFDSVIRSDSNIVRTFTTEHGTFQIRDSLFCGPGGFLHFETNWQVSERGLRLTTVIPKGRA